MSFFFTRVRRCSELSDVRADTFKTVVNSIFLCLSMFSVSIQAAEVERQLSTQVHSLRDDFREKSMSTSQHMTRLETLQAEVSRRRCLFSFIHHFILSADDWIGLSTVHTAWAPHQKRDTRTKKKKWNRDRKVQLFAGIDIQLEAGVPETTAAPEGREARLCNFWENKRHQTNSSVSTDRL